MIDGALVPYEIIWPFKMHEMTKFSIDIPGNARVQTAVFFLGMHKKSYEKLSVDLRKVLDDSTGRALAPIAAEVWDKAEQPGITAAKKRGNEFIFLSAAETDRIRKASKAAIDRWLVQGQEPRHRWRQGTLRRARLAGQTREVAVATYG